MRRQIRTVVCSTFTKRIWRIVFFWKLIEICGCVWKTISKAEIGRCDIGWVSDGLHDFVLYWNNSASPDINEVLGESRILSRVQQFSISELRYSLPLSEIKYWGGPNFEIQLWKISFIAYWVFLLELVQLQCKC